MTQALIQRARELAQSGQYRTVAAIREQLIAERFDGVHGYFDGLGFKKEMRALIAKARTGL